MPCIPVYSERTGGHALLGNYRTLLYATRVSHFYGSTQRRKPWRIY